MLKYSYSLLFIFILLFTNSFAQKGKHGVKTVSVSVKVNEYTSLTNSVSAGTRTITVASSSLNANARFTNTLTAGDLVMIMQMQGALIKLKPYNTWESYVTDSLYGRIYSYETCGNYEFAEVKSVISSTQIELNCGLTYNYSNTGKTQIIRVPRFSSLTVANTGTLTCDAWNGTVGGVLAVEVDGNTTINGIVSANGLGFRGGSTIASGGNNFYPLSVTSPTNNGAEKGEGVGSDRLNNTVDSLGKYCKGAPGNGGGGGNANNCGGGGGGNGGVINDYNGYGISTAGYDAIWNLEWSGRANVVSSGGGKGGYGSSTTSTVSPISVGPNSASWGSFRRISAGGFGGRPLDYSTGKIFMGGGGGGGHKTGPTIQSNGTNACNGGAGGGLIYFLNYGTISGTGTISANGANGNNAFGSGGVQGLDGAGGAGAGGTIILKSNGTISSITANANGGKGGDQVISGVSSEAQGPGGGGSGGYIAATNIGFTQNVNGGANGTTNSSAFDTEFPMNGATSGDIGTKNQIITPSYSLSASPNQTLCTNQTTNVSATTTNSLATIEWFNSATGGTALSTGTVYTIPSYSIAGTYTVFAGTCPGIYRLPIILTVTSGATIAINNPTICSGQTAILTASTSASSYTWNNGAITNSISVAPTISTIYTFSASTTNCTSTKTVEVFVATTPTLSVNSASICSGNSTSLSVSGSAANYTWQPSAQNSTSISVNPTSTTVYTITGSTSICSNTSTATVYVTSTPTITGVSNTTICPSQTASFNAGGATNYTWSPGNVNGATYSIAPVSNTTISVIGSNGNCLSSNKTVSISIGSNVSISVSGVTICPSQTATLSASSLDTYTWSTSANTNSITVSPNSTTVYTVNGTIGSCSGSQTVAVTVINQPTLAITGNSTICSGTSSTLTANGTATSYTWQPVGQISNSIAVNPNSTTIYTITGSNGFCSNTITSTLNVTQTPTITGVSNITSCANESTIFNASGATTYTWQPGNIINSSFSITPTTNTLISVIGANGSCTTQATASISILPNLIISVNNPTICAGQTTTLIASGVSTYTWNNTVNTNSIIVNPTTTSVYTISGNTGSCFGENTATVTVNQIPVLTATANPISICSGETTTLSVLGGNTYAWSNGVNLDTQTDNPTITTIYSVTATNNEGCENSTSITVSVTSIPVINVNPVTVCAGKTATLTATGAATYTWSTNENGDTIYPSPLFPTQYTVAGSTNGCASATYSTFIIPVASPTLTINTPTTTIGCAPLCIDFSDQTSSSCATITYNFGDSNIGNTNNPNHCYNASGNYTVTATCTNTLGCSSTYTLPTAIQVNSNPIANFTIEEGSVVSVGSPVNLTNTSLNSTASLWDLCNGNSSLLTNVTTSYADTGSCCITLIASNGTCTNTTTKCISIINQPTITIPNVFTPNGDTKNDLFKINSVGMKSLTCSIYDRWGLKLYEWDGLNGYWDGNTKNGNAPSGTYFYIINYIDKKDHSTTEKGFLNLFRD